MTPTETILKIAHSIPVLSAKLKDIEYHPTKFNPRQFYEMMGPWSSGERISGLFVIHVWSPALLDEWGEPFVLQDAVQRLSPPQRDAIAAWVKNPILP